MFPHFLFTSRQVFFFFNRNVYIYPRDVPNPLRAAILCVFLHVWIGRSGEGYLTTAGNFILYTETCDTTDSVCCFPKYYWLSVKIQQHLVVFRKRLINAGPSFSVICGFSICTVVFLNTVVIAVEPHLKTRSWAGVVRYEQFNKTQTPGAL